MKLVQQAIATLTIIVAASVASALVFAYLASAIRSRPLPTTSGTPSPLPDGTTTPVALPSPPISPIGTPSPTSPGTSIATPSSPGSSPTPTKTSPFPGGTSITDRVEERIRGFFTERAGVTVQQVQCPANVKTAAGSTFTCSTTAEGITFPVNVNITNAQGDFRVEVKGLMVLSRLEQQIRETVKEKTGIEVTANCGSRLRITKAGETFQCQLVSPQGSQPIEVTVEDDQGRVRWKL